MGLQVWLPLNGSLKNQGLSNVTVINNSTTINNNGKIGQCYSFDKSIPSYLKIDNPITSAEYGITFTFWIKIVANASGNNQIIHIGNGAGWNNNRCTCFIRSSTSQIVFCCGDGTDTSASHSTQYNCISSAINLNTWVHITCIYFNKNLKIYINGIQDKSYDTTIIPSFTNVDYIGIGAAPNASEPCSCMLNDVRIYDHRLSNKEVEEISKGLVLHYKLDDEYIDSSYANLITNSNNLLGWNKESACTITLESDGFYCIRSTSSSSGARYGIYKDITLQQNTTYTFSVDVRDRFHIGVTPGTSFAWNTTQNADTTTLTQFVYIFTTGTDNIKLRIYLYGYNKDNGETYVRFPKLELGSLATPWRLSNAELGTSINTIYDFSGYNRNGETIGTLTNNSDTIRYNSSVNFDGSSSGILISNKNLAPILNEVCSISFWIKSTGENGARSIYFSSYNGSPFWCIEKSAGNKFRYDWNGSPDLYSSGSIVDDSWNFICFVRESSTNARFYLNGGLDTTFTTACNALTNLVDIWRIGRDTRSGDGTPYKGKISDFRIYATALTDAQIKELYNTSVTIDNKGNIYSREYIEDDDNLNITKTGLFQSSIIHDDDDLNIASILKTEKQIQGNTLYEY